MTSTGPDPTPTAHLAPALASGTALIGDLRVPRMGFGTMRLTGPEIFGPPADPVGAVATVRRAVELGVRVLDTSWYYGPDTANAVIREALRPYPDDLVVVSKLGASRGEDASWRPALRSEQLREGAEKDLVQLGVDAVDVAHLRWTGGHGVDGVRFEDAVESMVSLRADGLIRRIGLSNVTLDQLETAMSITEVVTVSNPYNLLDRRDEPVLRRCAAEGIAYLPFFPLAAGSLGTPAPLVALADRRGVTVGQLALAWLLAHDASIVVIPGTSKVAHLQENVAAAAVTLSVDELALLDSLATPGTSDGLA